MFLSYQYEKQHEVVTGDYSRYTYKLLLDGIPATGVFWSELYLVATMVFLMGLAGLLESDNFLDVLINSEITMLGNNFHLLVSALLLADVRGQLYVLNFLSATASETTVGLGLLVLFYRTKGRMIFESILGLRG